MEHPLGIGFLNEVYCDIIASMKFRMGVCGYCGSIMVRMLILIWKSKTMTLTGIDFFRMLYRMGADSGEDVEEECEDSFTDDDEVEGESCQNQQT